MVIDHSQFANQELLMISGKKCLFSETAFSDHLKLLNIQNMHTNTQICTSHLSLSNIKATDHHLYNRI